MSELMRKRGARLGLVGVLVLVVAGVWLIVTGANRRSTSVFEHVAIPGVPKLPPLKGVEIAVVNAAANVHPPIERDYAARVVVELVTLETSMRLAAGVC